LIFLEKIMMNSIHTLSEEQKSKCQKIIHSAAVCASAGNLVPVPGVGIAFDTIAVTSMAMSLATVFGANISEQVAKGLAVTAIKHTLLKHPIRILSKELSKLIPMVGTVISAGTSAILIEAAGWSIVNDMAKASHFDQQRT
jgi:uncharacterized protein (DUF697 family)